MSKTKVFALAGGVLLLVGIFAFVWIKNAAPKYTNTITPAVVLLKTNDEYIQAKGNQSHGDFAAAEQHYQKALEIASDSNQKGQILFNIAYSEESLGHYSHAIQLYKQLVADPKNSRTIRAYAAQHIGFIHYSHFDTDRAALVKETFKDLPYSSFAAGVDDDLAYRKIFEYAAGFYPTMSSQARIAYWYANDVVDTLKSTTTPQAVAEIAIIDSNFKKADQDIMSRLADPAMQVYISDTYAREGMAVAKLASMGAKTFAEAETYFKKGVGFADAISRYGGERYRYAQFLGDTYGSSRSADVNNLLSVFSAENTIGIYAPVKSYLRAAATDKDLALDKNSILRLARMDAGFKTYLIALGWHEKDF